MENVAGGQGSDVSPNRFWIAHNAFAVRFLFKIAHDAEKRGALPLAAHEIERWLERGILAVRFEGGPFLLFLPF